MNDKILALVSQGEQSHIAVILAQRTLDRLQLEMEAARSALIVAQTNYDDLAVSVTGETNLPRPAFDDMIQKRVGALIELGLVGGDIDLSAAAPSVQPAAPLSEAAPAAPVSSTPAPNNPYGDDVPRSRSAYQKGYDDGITGQVKDINLYKRPSAQTAYAQGYDAGAKDKEGEAAQDAVASAALPDETPATVDAAEIDVQSDIEAPAEGMTDLQEQAVSSQDEAVTAASSEPLDTVNTQTTAPVADGSVQEGDEMVTFSPDGIFLTKARDEGAQAALANEPKSSCPYAPGPLRQSWENGYEESVDQRLQQMSSPEADLNLAQDASVIVLDTASSLTASQFAHSDQPDESIFDDDGPFGDHAEMADQVTIVSADNLDIAPFLRRGAEVH
ncbi:ribosome modulation factor [Microvirga sesbaniae]|uniref:ribosome modulation factor n=1 Tax=Microvirga sesbaniae TaxID=681392 RepID=UPI0021C7C755|nr:ribosome modulation factor [Microvirga sp. HBU67692]